MGLIMSQLPNDEDNDGGATSEQFTALLLRYLQRRAFQAQRRGAEGQSDEGQHDYTDDDDDDGMDTENEDSAWPFSTSKKKKKSTPKLDLIDDIKEEDESKYESLGRLKQWIDDGQIKDIEAAKQHFASNSEQKQSEHRPIIAEQSKNRFIPYNFYHLMELRETGNCSMYRNSKGFLGRCSDHLFSNHAVERFQGNSRVFCSDFSNDGNVLCVASQDHVIHLIDSRSGANCDKWPIYKQVESQFSGWSIIDVALSPDHEFVAYSGWSSSIYLVNAYGAHELHESHDLNISTFNSWGRCCVFGIEFDPNSRKIICALSGGCLILHDLERKINEFSDPSAHDDDVNQATFLDSNIIISGSDDALLRVWDTRQKAKCVGGFVGHYQGITCVSTPNDYGSSNYVLSNSKDQSMKLWDLRAMNSLSELSSTRASLQPSTGSFDYRYRGWNSQNSSTHKKKFRIDKSLVTYRGHSVSRTLCRSAFSPTHSTSAKYVYCGSSDCTIYIYETLTAKLHCTLRAHSDIVRDVCWHPFLPIIVSASWDGSVVRWNYTASRKDGTLKPSKKNKKQQTNNDDDQEVEYSDSDSGSDSEDNEAYKISNSVPLDMPEHLRKRNDYGYW